MAILKPSSQRYGKKSELIPKDDVPDDVGRPKHVALLSKKIVLIIWLCLFLITDQLMPITKQEDGT
jgi:hypothetical protein